MKYKTNLQKIDEFIKQLKASHKYYGVMRIDITDPLEVRMGYNGVVKHDALREHLRMIAENSEIVHLSLSSNDDREIVIILK